MSLSSLSPGSGKSIDELGIPFDAIDGSNRVLFSMRRLTKPVALNAKPRPLGGRGFLTGQEGWISRRR